MFAEFFTERRAEALRWGVCFAAVVAAHGIAAFVLLMTPSEASDFDAGAPIPVVMDASGNRRGARDPAQRRGARTARAGERPYSAAAGRAGQTAGGSGRACFADPGSPTPQPPVEERPPTSTPSVEIPPSENTPPTPGAEVQTPRTNVLRWQSELAAHLERFKRYPLAARAQGEQGIVRVAFTHQS